MKTPPAAPPDNPSVADLRVIVGWLLSEYEDSLMAKAMRRRGADPLGAELSLLGQATGLDLSVATARTLLDEARQATEKWAL